MSTKPKILITSAVGKTGKATTLQLLQKGYPVRAFVRKEDHRSDELERAGAEVFAGNMYDLDHMRKAMKGIDHTYQCAPAAANGLYFNTVFATAAYEEKIKHVVTLGQWLTSIRHPSLFTREVYLSDKIIKMRPEMTVTTINVGWFADNYLMVLDMAAHLGVLTMPLGDGTAKTNAPPSNEDIARVSVAALIDPRTHAGKTYRPTGPELLSPNEIADAMGRALGRKVKYQNISEKMMIKAMRALKPKGYSDAMLSQLVIYAREYRRGTFAINAPTQDVFNTSGHASEDFESIVRQRVFGSVDLSPSFINKLKAIASFAKILLTPALVPQKIETQRDYVQIAKPEFSQDNAEWASTHIIRN